MLRGDKTKKGIKGGEKEERRGKDQEEEERILSQGLLVGTSRSHAVGAGPGDELSQL